VDLKLADRVVLVTGGSSGIGLATVRLMLEEGACVISCARRIEALERSAQMMAAAGFGPERLAVRSCDVLDAEAVARLAELAAARFGRVDALVANAGQGRVSTFASTSDADWESELSLKFFSVIRPLRAFLPLLRRSDAASVVIVNSLLARQPEAHMVCTSAARAGVQNLAKSLSVELAPAIRVNSILLGVVNSGQWERRYRERAAPGQSMEDWLRDLARERQIPMGRLGRPEEPAAAIAFLASPLSGFTTGATIEVSGGVSRFA
jgi:NAD(P)-dependent dehydrogenase (short-subunit alcohol dehydrogenase family)